MPKRYAARNIATLLAACCLFAGATGTARATNSNPNYLPFGENASFLGNAGVGRASDTGAVYYNPAGLAGLGDGRVSVSGAVYMSFSTHFDALTRTDNTNIPFDASGFNTIPSTYVATRRFGDWVAALSVLVPNSLKVGDHAAFKTPNVKEDLVYSLSQSDLWIGLSAAHSIDPDWSIGFTVFAIEHEQINVIGADAQNVAAPLSVSSTFLGRESLLTFGVAATLGVSYVATDWIRFGVRAQTALAQVYGKGESYQIQRTLNGTPMAAGEDVQGPAHYGMPFDFSVGTAVAPATWMTLLADLSVQLGTTYSTFPASAVNETVTLVPTARVNLGVELTPVPTVPVRFGAYYDPSANGGHPGDDSFEKEDFYGLTAGVGLNDEHVYVWSSGEATPSGATGTTASVHSRGYGALLSTAYAF
jgi:hypothetical protein